MKRHVILSRQTFLLLVSGCLISVFVTADFAHQVAAREAGGEGAGDEYKYLKTFTDVLALVEKNYVKAPDPKEMIEGAIKGMLMSLDPHSSYMNKEVYKELQVETKGQFGGLGLEITIKDGLLTVVSPIEDSPAARAGVKAGDQIIKIGDEFAKDLTLVEAVKKMRGPKGESITISVHREGMAKLIPITIVRDVIQVKSVRSRMLEKDFGYIRLAQFQEGSIDEFSRALKALKEKTPKKDLAGLVFDLRNNPGGLLTEAVKVSDFFLKEGVIVYTDGRLESQKQKYFASDDGTEPDFPVVVLVNGGSASASEIVSGALQDRGRALVVGEQTFGKGSVQTILPMDNGGALRLTTALYYTGSGRSIQAEGVTPDVIVPSLRLPVDSEEASDREESYRIRERDLRRALPNPDRDKAAKKSKNHKESSDSQRHYENPDDLRIGSREAMKAELSKLLRSDPQLDEALRLLKTWKVFKGRPAIQANKEGKMRG